MQITGKIPGLWKAIFLFNIILWGIPACTVNEDLGSINNLRASKGEYNDYIKVEWDIVSGATYYILEKKKESDSAYGVATQGTMNIFEDYEAENMVKYLFRLTAKNGEDSVGPSEPVMGCRGAGCGN